MARTLASKRLGKVVVILSAVLLVGLGVLGAWLAARDRALSQRPDEKAPERAASVGASVLSVPIRFPLDAMARRAEAAAPSSYEGEGEGEDACLELFGWKQCAGTKYSYRAVRGQISIRQAPGNRIRVEVPVTVRGRGGLRGAGAEFARLDQLDFEAALVAVADITFQLDESWCPRPDVAADFRWLRGATVEIVSGVRLPIDGLVEERLREQVRQMGDEASKSIRCEDVRRQVAEIWSPRVLPLDVPDGRSESYLYIQPVTLAYSSLRVTQTAAEMSVEMNAEVWVDGDGSAAAASELPPAELREVSDEGLGLRVPVLISYPELAQRVNAELAGETLTIPTSLGDAEIDLSGLEVFPHGDALVLGARAEIDLPRRLFDVRGQVFLVGDPVARPDGRRLAFESLRYSRRLDSRLWSALSVGLESEILRRVGEVAEIDLSDHLQRVEDGWPAEFDGVAGYSSIRLGAPTLRLARAETTAEHLLLELTLESEAEVVVDG